MIWCIEDDASIRDIEMYALNSAGFETMGFEDGLSFWDELKKKFGDSVSMDSAATEFTDKFGEGPIKRLWRKIVSKGLTKIKKS